MSALPTVMPPAEPPWIVSVDFEAQSSLLRVNFDAGHGLGSTRSQIDDERADEFAFVLWRAGRKSVG